MRLLQLGLFLSNINFWTEVQSYGNLSYLRPSGFCMLGAVVTSSGQSVNQPVYTKSVRRRRIAIADTYHAEDNADIIRYYTGNRATLLVKYKRTQFTKRGHVFHSRKKSLKIRLPGKL